MALMKKSVDSEEIKRLATACRKYGVKTIKIGDLELTMSDFPPEKQKPRGKSVNNPTTSKEIETLLDTPPEDMLFWSVQNASFDEDGQ